MFCVWNKLVSVITSSRYSNYEQSFYHQPIFFLFLEVNRIKYAALKTVQWQETWTTVQAVLLLKINQCQLKDKNWGLSSAVV